MWVREIKTQDIVYYTVPKKFLKKFSIFFIFLLTESIFCDILIQPSKSRRQHGSIAQLGEHLPYKQRVTGSSPVVPTMWPGSSAG